MVLSQSPGKITDDGHSTYIKSIWPQMRIPNTPYHIRTITTHEAIRPKALPITIARRFAIFSFQIRYYLKHVARNNIKFDIRR